MAKWTNECERERFFRHLFSLSMMISIVCCCCCFLLLLLFLWFIICKCFYYHHHNNNNNNQKKNPKLVHRNTKTESIKKQELPFQLCVQWCFFIDPFWWKNEREREREREREECEWNKRRKLLLLMICKYIWLL